MSRLEELVGDVPEHLQAPVEELIVDFLRRQSEFDAAVAVLQEGFRDAYPGLSSVEVQCLVTASRGENALAGLKRDSGDHPESRGGS